MNNSKDIDADYIALNDLIVNCPELEELETLLGGFNLFQVLKFEHGEIRHSNVLSWILNPSESHGFGSLFLKKWLMRVVHESYGEAEIPLNAVDIDGWQLQDVEVRREWKNIDLLLILSFSNNEQWIVCIENKINAKQSKGQLRKYRDKIEYAFKNAKHRIYLLLSKNNEKPDDDAYISASYSQVNKALRECLAAQNHLIGEEPKFLLENYIRLLEEKFMDESEIARLVRKIYQQHQRALDVIFEQRPDNLKLISESLKRLLEEKLGEVDFQIDSSSKAYIRIMPRSWDLEGNRTGKAWSGSRRTILFELNLYGDFPKFYIISGKAPDAWINHLWEESARPPFKRKKKATRPAHWCTLHAFDGSKISLVTNEINDPDAVAKNICSWCLECIQDTNTQKVIELIKNRIPSLRENYNSHELSE